MSRRGIVAWGLASAFTVVCLPWAFRAVRYLSLPTTPPFDLDINFHQFHPSPDSPSLATDMAVDSATLQTLNQLNLDGVLDGSSLYMGYTTTTPTSKVTVVMLTGEPVISDADLDLPTSGSIVYLFKGDVWTAYPPVTNAAKQKIRIVHDPHLPGRFSVAVTGIKRNSPLNFTPAPR
jgi:hypothetical protein